MNINLGSVALDIHVTVGAGEPVCVGTAHVPLTAEVPSSAQVVVDSPLVAARSEIAKVLREAADEIENPIL